MAEHFSDTEVSRFVEIGENESAKDVITFHINDSGCRWGIFLKEKPAKLIGTCGYHCWLREEKYPEAETVFDLAKAFWGRGYMKEAMIPVIRFGFGSMNLSTINALIHDDNQRCKKFIKKLGFQITHEIKDVRYRFTLSKNDWSSSIEGRTY